MSTEIIYRSRFVSSSSAASKRLAWHVCYEALHALQDSQGLLSTTPELSSNLPTLRKRFQPALHTTRCLAGASRITKCSADLGGQQQLPEVQQLPYGVPCRILGNVTTLRRSGSMTMQDMEPKDG
jgi:hypothetical protein